MLHLTTYFIISSNSLLLLHFLYFGGGNPSWLYKSLFSHLWSDLPSLITGQAWSTQRWGVQGSVLSILPGDCWHRQSWSSHTRLLAPVHTRTRCKKTTIHVHFPHRIQIALLLHSAVGVSAMLMRPHMQVTNAVHLPAPDHMVQMDHAIRLKCSSKIGAALLLCNEAQFEPIQNEWAQITAHWIKAKCTCHICVVMAVMDLEVSVMTGDWTTQSDIWTQGQIRGGRQNEVSPA